MGVCFKRSSKNKEIDGNLVVFEAQWLAYALPCRRSVHTLTGNNARCGADVVRYSFIAADLHHLLLAGLPAHTQPMGANGELRLEPLQ
jgi:hypothetical protein